MEKFKLQHPALAYIEDQKDFPDWAGDDAIFVPGKMIVCPTCRGTGAMERQDLDMSRLTDSMLEYGDLEGFEHYMKGGYDVICTECHGKNVVFVPNIDDLPEDVLEEIKEWEDSEREYRLEVAAERRAGA